MKATSTAIRIRLHQHCSCLADLPCPRVDVDLLVKLARFALNSNFGWPRPVVTLPEFAGVFDRFAKQAVARAVVDRSSNDATETIELQLLGPGSPPPIYFQKSQGRWTPTDCPPAETRNRMTLLGNSPEVAKCFDGRMTLSELASAGWLACVGKGSQDWKQVLLELESDLKSHS